VKSLRRYVIVGALLWTVGLTSAWSVAITLNPAMFFSIRIVHSHAHFMGFLALVALATGFAVVRSGFSPFAELRRRLADVQRGTERQLVGNYPAEVQPLVSDLNALLGHRDDAIRRAVAKAGDLAHGLKTPLAVLSQEAERAAAAGHADLAAVLAEQVERMRRQIEYHLAHARAAAAGSSSGARCAVAGSAGPLARTLLRLHAGRGLSLDVLVPLDHVVRCQREDLDEMLGSLLDNACKWARARVAVSSSVRTDGTVEIFVDDDGPGIAPALREAVLQRGVRADEAAPGSGFGLAIVRELAELYGGAIALDASPAGGLRARLRLPSAPA
jgi:signal transduction histidine kinase